MGTSKGRLGGDRMGSPRATRGARLRHRGGHRGFRVSPAARTAREPCVLPDPRALRSYCQGAPECPRGQGPFVCTGLLRRALRQHGRTVLSSTSSKWPCSWGSLSASSCLSWNMRSCSCAMSGSSSPRMPQRSQQEGQHGQAVLLRRYHPADGRGQEPQALRSPQHPPPSQEQRGQGRRMKQYSLALLSSPLGQRQRLCQLQCL